MAGKTRASLRVLVEDDVLSSDDDSSDSEESNVEGDDVASLWPPLWIMMFRGSIRCSSIHHILIRSW